jgi:hypothetical protein
VRAHPWFISLGCQPLLWVWDQHNSTDDGE